MRALWSEPEQAARDVCRLFPVAQRGRDREHPLSACRNLYVYMLVTVRAVQLQMFLPCFGSLCFPPKALGCSIGVHLCLTSVLTFLSPLCPVPFHASGQPCFPLCSVVSLALASRSHSLLLEVFLAFIGCLVLHYPFQDFR